MSEGSVYLAITDNTAEARAVRDAFAPSVHWGFDIVARTGDRVLVDATEFFMRDARGVINQIEQRGQGSEADLTVLPVTQD